MQIKLKKNTSKKGKTSSGGLSRKPNVFNLEDSNDDNDEVDEKQKEREAILKQQAIAEKNRVLQEQLYKDSDVFKYDEYYEDKEEEKRKQEDTKKQNNKSKYSQGLAELKKERERRKMISDSSRFINGNQEELTENVVVFETSTFKKQKSEMADMVQNDLRQFEKEAENQKNELGSHNPLRNFYLQSLGDEVTPEKDNDTQNVVKTKTRDDATKNVTDETGKIDTAYGKSLTRSVDSERIHPSGPSNTSNQNASLSKDAVSLPYKSAEFKNILKVYVETTFITEDQLSEMRKRYLMRKSQQC